MNTMGGVDRLPLYDMSDEILCAYGAQGNRQAEEILVSRYHRLVRSIARPFYFAGGDSEDLLQEGMLGLLNAVREYDPQRDATFRTFAETCVRNRVFSVIKAANSGKYTPLNHSIPLNAPLFDVGSPLAQVDPEHWMIDREKTAGLLVEARKRLSDFEVRILGYYLDGLTCREISETVGKPPKSVDNAIQRIRRKLGRHNKQATSANS